MANQAVTMEQVYDVVVIGAESAGSIVAGMLAAETDARVLVLEDGGRDSSPLIRIPAGFSKLFAAKKFLYPYETVPQRHLGVASRSPRGAGLAAADRSTRWCVWSGSGH